MTQKVKTAKKRPIGSTRWLERQLNDPYVAQAKRDGYKSRAAYKLIEMDEKFHLLKPGMKVVDLGAAPGGWTQVAVQKTKGAVVGIDLLEMDAIPGAELLQGDFTDDEAPEKLKALLGGKADAVLSDMAPNTTGVPEVDHLRIIALCEMALDFALDVLAPGGCFVCKVRQGGTESELLALMKKHFTTVRHAKPPASRKDSAEAYVVATGFKECGQASSPSEGED